jgi:hypothetical protein
LTLELTQPLYSGYRGSFLGVKQLGLSADHPLPSSTKAKNKYSYTFTPSLCLHGMLRGDLYLYLYPYIYLYYHIPKHDLKLCKPKIITSVSVTKMGEEFQN